MKTVRAKITLLTICAVMVSTAIIAVLGVTAIRGIGNKNASDLLYLLCQTGEKNLDRYFESVEQSVEMVSAYVHSDLEETPLSQLSQHLDRAKEMFETMTRKTSGVCTYYYRIDPTVSAEDKGFWFVSGADGTFREHLVTDISLYDMDDTRKLVWFTVPRATGQAIWLPPYITENLDVRVISYNVPIYKGNRFIGVVGIEIDYETMARQVDSISLYESGYAFLTDSDGNLVYHPKVDVTTLATLPDPPEGLLQPGPTVRYRYGGADKEGVWLPLHNGMRLTVAVPRSEIDALWQDWMGQILIAFLLVLTVFLSFTVSLADKITKPLQDLIKAAESLNMGVYDVTLNWRSDDELGMLTRTFLKLSSHLRERMRSLNDLAYVDPLTNLRNKGAFDDRLQAIQDRLDEAGRVEPFAVCIFDCNDLKKINDRHGHEHGDLFLKNAAFLVSDVFGPEQVYRIGGDEFAAVLDGGSYLRRQKLMESFERRCRGSWTPVARPWERVDVAWGMAEFVPGEDSAVSDVVRNADRRMYDYKWKLKRFRKEDGANEPLS